MLNFEELKKINIKDLERNELDNTLEFTNINDILNAIKDKLLFFENKTVNLLTQNTKNEISNLSNSFLDLCKRIKEFKQEQNESLELASKRKDNIINEANNLEKNFIRFVLPVVNNIILSDKETEKTLNNLSQKAEEINETLSQSLEKFNQSLQKNEQKYNQSLKAKETTFQNSIGEAQRIVQEAKTFSTKKIAEKYGKTFGEQAGVNKKIAIGSLVLLIVFILALVIMAIKFFKPLLDVLLESENNIEFKYVITNIVFRLTLLSIVFIAVKESLKNFNVNMHLYNLNKHRQNSLESFEAFTNTPETRETRDFIIKEIAKTIYSVNKIGYLSEDKKAIDISQAIDLIKSVKP